MTVRLITGPPGAGKNTYVEKHRKEGDLVVDWDHMKAAFPHMSIERLKEVRQMLEDDAKAFAGDAWVIRCVADGARRTELADALGASEVVVLETDAETAKANVTKRGRNPERNDEVFAAIDDWWSQYGVVESHLIVRPDKGHPNSDRKKKMADTDEKSGSETDKGFPADTKIVDMTAEEQAAYWKHKSRKHESNVNTLRAELEGKKVTPPAEPAKPAADADNAPLDRDALRKELLADLKREQAPALVRSQFEALIGDRLPEDTRNALLDDLNLGRFVKEDGSVDKDLIKTRAELLAPVSTSTRTQRTHQGHRKQERTASVQSGRDLHAEFSKKR